MKIILTARVANLGQIGEIVEVKSGYAKNFLIPSKKAIPFTPNSQKIFDLKKMEFENANQGLLSQAEKIKNKLEGKNIVIIEAASDDGRLYGSVNTAVIAAKINEILVAKTLTRADIFLAKPIKEIGVYKVKLNLHSDVQIEAKLVVSRLESEVEALLKKDNKVVSDEAAPVVEKKSKKKKNDDLDIVDEVVVEATEDAVKEKKVEKKSAKKK